MNHRPRRLHLLLAAGALLLASQLRAAAATAQDAPDPRAGRVDALFADLYRSPSPGVAVAVVRDGRVLLRRGYGLASVEHRVRVTPSTAFDVASVAKMFTGLAVAMLVTEGKVRLSDDVRTHLPELPDLGQPVTVGHLVHHTSGVRDWPGALLVGGWRFDDAITFNQILTMAYGQRGLNFAPGAEHLYSNTNYNLLAEMVRRVTGRTFRAWTDERIFRPLGMADTHFREHYTEVIDNRAFGYARGSDGRFHHMPNNLTALGSSSLFTTADDLARWVLNFETAAVGGRAALALARERGTLNDGTKTDYAFGLIHGRYRGLPMLYHDGGWAGFASLVVYFPEQRFGLVLLANGNSVNVDDAANKITDIYLEKELAPAGPPPAAQAAKPAAVVPPAVLGEYVGLYRVAPGSYVRIRPEGGALTSEVTRGKPTVLSPLSEREFSTAGDGEKVVFARDTSGKVSHLNYRGRRAERVDEAGAARPEDYAGEYESEELGTFYLVAHKGGALEMRHRRHGTIQLTHLWRDDFGSAVSFMRSVEFQRDGEARVTGLLVNGDPRNRNLRFRKRR